MKRMKITTFSCGGAHTAAIPEDGTLYTWGRSSIGRLGHTMKWRKGDISHPIAVDKLKDVKMKQVSCGTVHTAALSVDNEVWVFGSCKYSQLGFKMAGIEVGYVQN